MLPPAASTNSGLPFDDFAKDAALAAPVRGLVVKREDLGQGQSEIAFDLGVELDERHSEMLREAAAEGRFAGAAQSDQRDPAVARSPLGQREMRADQALHLGQLLGRQPAQQIDDLPQFGGLPAVVADQPRQRLVQRRGDPLQQRYRDVAATGLELGQIALRQAGVAGQDLAGHAAACALFPHPLAELSEIVVLVRKAGWGSHA